MYNCKSPAYIYIPCRNGYNGFNGLNGISIPGQQGQQGVQGPQGLQGSIGLTGTQGSVGLTGTQGSIGLTGPQGPPSILNYFDAFALMPPDNSATIAVGTPILFPQTGPNNGVITRIDNSHFNLPNIGMNCSTQILYYLVLYNNV